MQVVNLNEYEIAVGLDRIPKTRNDVVFGFNADVSVGGVFETIVSQGGTVAFPSDTGEGVEILSSSGSDTQTILVQGLDSDWLRLNETVTLTGTTAVTLTNNFVRINRMLSLSATDLIGTVTLRDSATSLITFLEIPIGHNIAQSCQISIPDNEVCVIREMGASMNKATGANDEATIRLGVRTFGGAFLKTRRIGLQKSGDSNEALMISTPTGIPARSDIIMEGTASTASIEIAAWIHAMFFERKGFATVIN